MTQTADTWHLLQNLFKQAVMHDGSDRESFIASVCAGNAKLESHLRDLLQAHDAAGDFMTMPPWGSQDIRLPDAEIDQSLVGRRIGQYIVTRAIATGGMGAVYEAQQENPHRTVALKVIRAGFASRSAQRRFEFEVEALGRLQHPAIAQIFEAGAFDLNGIAQPFFAMEFVKGQPLTEYVRDRGLSIEQRLQLLVRVCLGVEHAHQRGVIHRDLKPGNILVADAEDGPQPKILDFGVARSVGAQVQPETLTAQGSQLIGTLAYMSPEQIYGDATQIDTRSDVYALGVLMYELLADRLPLHDLTSKTFGEALRAIREDDPPRLSAIVRSCRGDLDWISMRAIAKEPARRYGSPAELAADIQRHLNNEPVLAGPPRAGYRLSKWVKRHRAAAFAVAAVVLVVLVGVMGLTAMYIEMRAQRDSASAAQQSAEAAEKLTKSLFQQSLRMGGRMAEFTEQELSNLAGSTRARLELAQQALAEIDSLQSEAAELDMLYLHSYAAQRVGEAQCASGHSAALRNFERVLEMRRRLVELLPDDEPALRAVGVGHWRMSDALILMGRFNEAQQHNRQARDILEDNHQRWTFPPLQQGVYLGIANRRIGEMEFEAGRHSQALESFGQSLAMYRVGLAEHPDNLELLRGHALVLRGSGEASAAAGASAEAIDHLTQSVRALENLSARTGPSNVWERSNLCKALLALAEVQQQQSDFVAAHAAATRAHELSGALAAADPFHFPSHYLRARSHLALSQVNRQARDFAAARQHAESARAILQSLTVRDPDDFNTKRELIRANQFMQEFAP